MPDLPKPPAWRDSDLGLIHTRGPVCRTTEMTMKRSAEEILRRRCENHRHGGRQRQPGTPIISGDGLHAESRGPGHTGEPRHDGRNASRRNRCRQTSGITLPVWMVDVFRPPEACPPIAEEAIAIGATCLWLREGVISDEAAALASGAGIEVVMDLCPKKLIEAANMAGDEAL